MFSIKSSIFALLATTVGVTYAVPPVSIQGPNFVDGNGKRFKIVGIDYQPGGQSAFKGGSDPLSDSKACLRDAALMQQLGVNTVRVYNLDQTISHDECMSIFNEAGIYMILDVNTPFISLYRTNTAKSYNAKYLERVFGMIESFKNYDNTLGFFGANEVMNNLANAQEPPPFIRAVIRDMKQYIAQNSKRQLFVGYSAADVRDILEDTWAYMQCSMGEDDPSQSDFFALNSYSWCAKSNIQKSGYNTLQDIFSKSAIPVFFSEYGCNEGIEHRIFTEVPAIYGPEMDSLSGGLVYMWTQDTSDFGLVSIAGDKSAHLLPDFDNLQKELNGLDTSQIASAPLFDSSAKAPSCSSSLIKEKSFSTNFKLPAAPSEAENWIKNGVPTESYYAGHMVDISSLKSTYGAVGSSGQKIQNLAVNPISDNSINVPSGAVTSEGKAGSGSGTQTSTGGGDEDTPNAAPRTVGSAVAVSSGLLSLLAMFFSLY